MKRFAVFLILCGQALWAFSQVNLTQDLEFRNRNSITSFVSILGAGTTRNCSLLLQVLANSSQQLKAGPLTVLENMNSFILIREDQRVYLQCYDSHGNRTPPTQALVESTLPIKVIK